MFTSRATSLAILFSIFSAFLFTALPTAAHPAALVDGTIADSNLNEIASPVQPDKVKREAAPEPLITPSPPPGFVKRMLDDILNKRGNELGPSTQTIVSVPAPAPKKCDPATSLMIDGICVGQAIDN